MPSSIRFPIPVRLVLDTPDAETARKLVDANQQFLHVDPRNDRQLRLIGDLWADGTVQPRDYEIVGGKRG